MKLTINLEPLLKKAKELQKNAYAPYSKFRVAAIVLLADKKEIYGVNVENAAYSVAICAERTALAQVFVQGYQKENIIGLFLITDSKDIAWPCGVCRQFMIETIPETCPIYISSKNKNNNVKNILTLQVKDLIPHPFKANSFEGS